MFEYLERIDQEIYKRYLTLEGDIKAKSNSFFDAYLDLVEETLKKILTNGNISFNPSKTCGNILKQDDVKDYLLNTIKIDSLTYDKLIDYTKKVNDHKHKKQKFINIDSVTKYLKVYFSFVSKYAKYLGIEDIEEFKEERIIALYGALEANNYNEDLLEIRNQLKELNDKIGQSSQEEKDNDYSYYCDLNRFVIGSKKTYISSLSDHAFRVDKIFLLVLLALLFTFISLSTYYVYMLYQIYSPYSFLTNLYALFLIPFFFSTLTLKREMKDDKLVDASIYYSTVNKDGLWVILNQEKTRLKLTRILAIVGIACDFIMVCTSKGPINLSIPGGVFLMLSGGLLFGVKSIFKELCDSYIFIKYKGVQEFEKITLYQYTLSNKLIDEKDFKNIYHKLSGKR